MSVFVCELVCMSVVLDIKLEVKSTGSDDWLKARKRNVEENGGRGHISELKGRNRLKGKTTTWVLGEMNMKGLHTLSAGTLIQAF